MIWWFSAPEYDAQTVNRLMEGRPEDVPLMREIMLDPRVSEQDRVIAMGSGMISGDASLIPTYRSLLQDRRERVRMMAALGLLYHDDPSGVRTDLKIAGDPTSRWSWVYEEVGEEVGELYRKPVFLKEAVRLLEDRDQYVRRGAIRLLSEVAGDDMGYDPQMSPKDQPIPLRRWQKWLEAQHADPESGASLEPPSKSGGAVVN